MLSQIAYREISNIVRDLHVVNIDLEALMQSQKFVVHHQDTCVRIVDPMLYVSDTVVRDTLRCKHALATYCRKSVAAWLQYFCHTWNIEPRVTPITPHFRATTPGLTPLANTRSRGCGDFSQKHLFNPCSQTLVAGLTAEVVIALKFASPLYSHHTTSAVYWN